MNKLLSNPVNYYKILILKNKNWVYFALAIFAIGAILGLIISNTIPFVTKQILLQYANSLDKNLTGLNLSIFIFQRNFTIVVLSSFFGIFLGLVPAVVAFFNGLILGLLVGYPPIYKTVNPWQLFLLLFPHGIFEYSATFLAFGFSLRLGLNWLLPRTYGKRLATLGQNLVESLKILILCFVLLVIAAFIEGVLTAKIACFLGNICR